MPEGHERHNRIRHSRKQRPIPIRRRRRSTFPAAEMVPMFRLHHLDTVPGLVVGIRSGAAGGSQDEPSGGIEEHLRHHHQQSDLQFRLDHPVPEQVRSAGEEGGQSRNGHTLVFPAVRREFAFDTRRAGVHIGDVHGGETGT